MNADVPPPDPKPRRVALVQAPNRSSGDLLFRLLTVAAILAALALALWSLFWVWFPLQKQSQELTARVSRLSDETDHLDRKWTKAQAAQVNADYLSARSRLFVSEAAFNEWLGYLKAQSVPLNMGVKVELGKLSPLTTNGQQWALIPATVSLDFSAAPGSKAPSYQRLLRLTQALDSQSKRADLIAMTVEGGPASVSRAVLDFSLWASEKEQP